MPRLAGAASALFLVLVVVSYGLRLEVKPLPVPIFVVLTILFITSGSMIVFYVSARAYLKERLPSMLFLGSASLIFGVTSFVAALAALMAGQDGSNPAATIFIVGASLSSVSHLTSVGSRRLGNRHRRGSAKEVMFAFTVVLALTISVIVAAFAGFFPTFLVSGEGTTPVAKGLLTFSVTSLGLASLLIVVSLSVSDVLNWYSRALTMGAVGLLGILLSNWVFTSADFLEGRAALCLAGGLLVMSVVSAERGVQLDPDSVLRELFKPLETDVQAPPPESRDEVPEDGASSLYERSTLLEADPSSNYERAVVGFALKMAAAGRVVFAFTSIGSPVYKVLRKVQGIRVFALSEVSYPKASSAPFEVMVPRNDLAVLLSVINEAVTKTPESKKAVIFDNISSLILETGFQDTYKFLKQVNEITGNSDAISLFVMLSKAHEGAIVSLLQSLYSGHIVNDAKGSRVTK